MTTEQKCDTSFCPRSKKNIMIRSLSESLGFARTSNNWTVQGQNRTRMERMGGFSSSGAGTFISHSCSWQLLTAEHSVSRITSLITPLSLGLCHWSLPFFLELCYWPLPFLWDYVTDHFPFLWDYITDHSPFWGHITDHFPFSGITSPTTPLSLGLHHWPRPLPWDYITGHSPFSRIMTLTISLSLGLHHWPYPFSGSQAFGPSLVIAPISLAFHLVDSRNVNLQPL